jgi:ATP-dependent RNA helicase RhlE
MTHFSELNLCTALRTNLEKNNFVIPTPVQAQAIPPLMEGRDVVATAQTGTGKTLAFAIPILEALMAMPRSKSIKALILSPTRELAIQIEEAISELTPGTRITTAVVVGGMSEARQLRDVAQGAEIVIATPGRLCDYIDRRLINLSETAMIVLDEADRMLDMGFLPSLRLILDKLPAKRQTMLFSATIETSVAHLVHSYVRDHVRVEIGASTRPAEQVDLYCFEISERSKFDLLLHLLKREEGSVLVFTSTRMGADRLAKFLSWADISCTVIHGDRTQSERNQALQGFKDGAFRVLVATDVAARGIHVDGIAHVVNYDLPQVPEDFIHRVGRTGRAGARGSSWTFALPMERADIRGIEKMLNIKIEYQDVPPLPHPLGLIADDGVIAASEAVSAPKPPEKPPARKVRSFSPGRRRR